MTAKTAAIFTTDTRLPAVPSIDDKKDPDLYNELNQLHNAIRLLQQFIDLFTAARFVAHSAVSLSVGQFVTSQTGAVDLSTVNLADNSNYTKPCIGFIANSDGVGVEVQTFGLWQFGNGTLTPGATYYLGTNGGMTSVAPVAAGKLVQQLGIALDTNTLMFHPAAKYKEL